MKRIRILACVASSDGWHFDPGVIVRVTERFKTNEEVPADAAAKWVQGGVIAEKYADEVEEKVQEIPAPPEPAQEETTATVPDAPERAVVRRRRKGR